MLLPWRAIVFIAGALLWPLESFGRDLPGARNLPKCAVSQPDDFGAIPEAATSDDEDSDEGDDDDGDASDDAAGIETESGQCIFPSMEVVSGVQLTRVFPSAILGQSPLSSAPTIVSQLSAKFGLTHVDGSMVDPWATTVSLQSLGDGTLSVAQASLNNSRLAFGVMASRFDTWSGDEFTFRSLASSQSPSVASAVLWRGERALLLVAVEDPSARRITVSGYGPFGAPDPILRWAGALGRASLTVSVAGHETTFADGGGIWGRAAQISARYDFEGSAEGSYVIAQGAIASQALGYLGINTRTNSLGLTLPGTYSAQVAERGGGVSGALVGVWQAAPQWRFAGYATMASLSVPGFAGGQLRSTRVAANVMWSPIKNLDFVLEGGFGSIESRIPLVPSARQFGATVTVARSF